MTLSTVSPRGNINSRTVLLKGINNKGFIFIQIMKVERETI